MVVLDRLFFIWETKKVVAGRVRQVVVLCNNDCMGIGRTRGRFETQVPGSRVQVSGSKRRCQVPGVRCQVPGSSIRKNKLWIDFYTSSDVFRGFMGTSLGYRWHIEAVKHTVTVTVTPH